MTDIDEILTDVRTDLLSGMHRANRRRTRRRTAAAVPLLGALGAASMLFIQSENNPAYALMQRSDGSISVEIRPEFDDVDSLRDELTEAGLDVSVVHLRAHPSMEGLVEVVSHTNAANGAVEFADGQFVIDVVAAEGPIEVLIYSATDDGDQYQAAPSLFTEGQPLAGLHCTYGDAPMPSADLEEQLDALGVDDVTWTVFGETDPETMEISYEDFDERPDGVVTEARMRSNDSVWVVVDPDGNAAATSSILMHDGTHETSYPECSEVLASRWLAG